jgi:hypothetical protein
MNLFHEPAYPAFAMPEMPAVSRSFSALKTLSLVPVASD